MLAQKLALSYTTKIIEQFFQIIASIVVARIAGPGVLGTVAFGLAYVSMFTSISDLGFGTAYMKKISEGGDLSTCLGTFARIKISLILAYIIVVIGFFCTQKYIFHTQFESRDHIIVIFIMLAAVSVQQLFMICNTTFTSYTQVAKSNLPNMLRTLLYQILRIIIVLLGYRAVALAFGNLVATILIMPLYIYLFKDYRIGKYDKNLAKQYLKIALPVMLIAITTKLTVTIDKVLLQFFTSSEQVGYYAASYRVGGFVLLIGQSVCNLFFPIFSKAFSNNNVLSVKSKLEKFERFSFLFVMPVVILLTLNADVIVKVLLGREYISSISIMQVINIAMFLMVVNVPFGSVITGKGDFNTSARLNIYNFVIYAIVLIVLIHPKFLNLAGLGTAISLLISYLFLGIIYRIYAKKYVPIISHHIAVKFMLYGVINFLIFLYFIHYQLISNTIIFRIIFALIYVIVTYFSFFILGMMKKADWIYLKTLIDIRSVGRYVKSEVKDSGK